MRSVDPSLSESHSMTMSWTYEAADSTPHDSVLSLPTTLSNVTPKLGNHRHASSVAIRERRHEYGIERRTQVEDRRGDDDNRHPTDDKHGRATIEVVDGHLHDIEVELSAKMDAVNVLDTRDEASVGPHAASGGTRAGEGSSVNNASLEKIYETEWTYEGWQVDVDAAEELYENGAMSQFEKKFAHVAEKQRVHDDLLAYNRLKALAELNLTYPSHQDDVERLEKWNVKNKPSTENEERFLDMLDGLRNKDQLLKGDRSHHCIRSLDQLQLTYPGWDKDYQAVIHAHCEQPALLFPNAFHCMQERQRVHEGDRSHWRLVELDSIKLTYPNWEEDVAVVEEWHFQNADSPEADEMFMEVLDGMKDEQKLHVEVDQATAHMPKTVPSTVSTKPAMRSNGDENSGGGEASGISEMTLDQSAATTAEPSAASSSLSSSSLAQPQSSVSASHISLRPSSVSSSSASTAQSPVYRCASSHSLPTANSSAPAPWIRSNVHLSRKTKLNLMVKTQSSLTESHSERSWSSSESDDLPSSSSSLSSASSALTPTSSTASSRSALSPHALGIAPTPIVENKMRRNVSPSHKQSWSSAQRFGYSYDDHEDDGRNKSWSDDTIEEALTNINRALREHHTKHSAIIEQRESHNQRLRKGRSGSASPSASASGTGGWSSSNASRLVLPSREKHRMSGHSADDTASSTFGTCAVCHERRATHIMIPCGHLCVCTACSTRTMMKHKRCPLCRAEADNTYRVRLN